jgi:hypothetical protein
MGTFCTEANVLPLDSLGKGEVWLLAELELDGLEKTLLVSKLEFLLNNQ